MESDRKKTKKRIEKRKEKGNKDGIEGGTMEPKRGRDKRLRLLMPFQITGYSLTGGVNSNVGLAE